MCIDHVNAGTACSSNAIGKPIVLDGRILHSSNRHYARNAAGGKKTEKAAEHLWSQDRRIDDLLQLFDGRVTLRAEMKDAGPSATATEGVHAHVLTTLHEHDDEVLDA